MTDTPASLAALLNTEAANIQALSARVAALPTTPPPSGSNVFTPITGDSSYALVFDEEFNGTALDTSKWAAQSGTGPGTYSNNILDPAQVTVSGGFARLNIVKSGTTPPFRSGFIQTGGSPGNFHFGPNSYVEARVKMPTSANGAAQGACPALWGNGFYTGGPNNDPPEIDLFEWHASFPTELWPLAAFAYPGSTGKVYTPTLQGKFVGNANYPQLGVDWGAGFHVIGMLWTTTAISWYFDGVLMGTINGGQPDFSGQIVKIPTAPIDLILNNSEDLNSEVPTAKSVYPQTLIADYIHVYTQGGTAITPQTGYGGPGDSTGSGSPTS